MKTVKEQVYVGSGQLLLKFLRERQEKLRSTMKIHVHSEDAFVSAEVIRDDGAYVGSTS